MGFLVLGRNKELEQPLRIEDALDTPAKKRPQRSYLPKEILGLERMIQPLFKNQRLKKKTTVISRAQRSFNSNSDRKPRDEKSSDDAKKYHFANQTLGKCDQANQQSWKNLGCESPDDPREPRSRSEELLLPYKNSKSNFTKEVTSSENVKIITPKLKSKDDMLSSKPSHKDNNRLNVKSTKIRSHLRSCRSSDQRSQPKVLSSNKDLEEIIGNETVEIGYKTNKKRSKIAFATFFSKQPGYSIFRTPQNRENRLKNIQNLSKASAYNLVRHKKEEKRKNKNKKFTPQYISIGARQLGCRTDSWGSRGRRPNFSAQTKF